MTSWPHAPSKVVTHPGTYFITGSTYHKVHFFNSEEKLDYLHDSLLSLALELDWQLQAWAVFPNHYHSIGFSPDKEKAASELSKRLHGSTSRGLNETDGLTGRMVWYRSWDTRITFEKSYLARLAYVHNNPVKHRLATDPTTYRWCSAKWFADHADRPFRETIDRIKWDTVKVEDDF